MSGPQQLKNWLVARVQGLWHCFDRAWGRAWAIVTEEFWLPLAENPNGKDGTSILTHLATFAVGQGGALTLAAQYTDNKWLIFWLYVILAIFTLIAIGIIMRLRAWKDPENPPPVPQRYFDRATISMGYWTSALSVLLPTIILSLVITGIISPPSRRIPFDHEKIACDEIVPPARPGQGEFHSLLGTPSYSPDVIAGDRILGEWLAGGADTKNWLNPLAFLGQVGRYLSPFRKKEITQEEKSLAIEQMLADFDKSYGSKAYRPASEGLYAIRQKTVFAANFYEFKCSVHFSDATEDQFANRLAFLVHTDDKGRMNLRQVYFELDPKKGLTGKLRVEPNKGERLVILTYLKNIQEKPSAEIEVIR